MRLNQLKEIARHHVLACFVKARPRLREGRFPRSLSVQDCASLPANHSLLKSSRMSGKDHLGLINGRKEADWLQCYPKSIHIQTASALLDEEISRHRFTRRSFLSARHQLNSQH